MTKRIDFVCQRERDEDVCIVQVGIEIGPSDEPRETGEEMRPENHRISHLAVTKLTYFFHSFGSLALLKNYFVHGISGPLPVIESY